jgi:hypothetical protein
VADNQDPKTPEPPEPTTDELEAKFWATFETKMDNWFERKIEKYRTTATSRTGRTTLPEIMASMIFGPPKEK